MFFGKKFVKHEKDDDITPFDGIQHKMLDPEIRIK